jgi:hypothetical protein
VWRIKFNMPSLANELAIRFRRPFTEADADYHLRRHRLKRFGETIGGDYFSETEPAKMIENESRYWIACQIEEAEEF